MLIKLLRFVVILFPFLTQADDSLDSKINHILAENYQSTHRFNIAIQVKDLESGKEIFSLNPYHFMIPASTTKTFTAYAALDFLGPDFIYKTQILFDKNKINSDGVLSDNLYIKFSGDPSLTKDNLIQMISELKHHNINIVAGNVIIDDLSFDQYYKADGWSWDDNKFCFAAPTSAIAIDKNCFHLDLLPAKNVDNIAELKGFSVAQVSNKITTKDNSNCSSELIAHHDNSYELTGCLDIRSPTLPLKIAYQNPRLMIINLLKEQDIEFQGDFFFNNVPQSYQVMIEHKSAPLSELVKQMNKNSDNMFADNFVKTIGAQYYAKQGSFANGTKAIAEIIGNQELQISDGSGGSRYNLIAPDQLVDLFMLAHKSSQIWSHFYNSLPISAVDGSLEKRLTKLNGKIRAKTGNMNGVVNLVGYLEKNNGKVLVFAIMINGCKNKKTANDLIDKILEMLAE